jgi:hypothetical protein
MAVLLVRLHPKEPFARVHDLRLVADPRRSREKNISGKNIEQGKEKRLGARSDHDLLRRDVSS